MIEELEIGEVYKIFGTEMCYAHIYSDTHAVMQNTWKRFQIGLH